MPELDLAHIGGGEAGAVGAERRRSKWDLEVGPPADFPELEGHAGDGVAGSGAVLAAPYVALPLQCGHIGRGLGGYNCVEFAFKVGGIEVILMMRNH